MDSLKVSWWCFEWFAEYFLKYFDGDNLFLNVTDYSPAKASSDYGVDGVAKYSKDLSKVVCLQHKYKSNSSKKLSSKEDGLSNFGVNAVYQGIPVKLMQSIWCFLQMHQELKELPRKESIRVVLHALMAKLFPDMWITIKHFGIVL